MELREVLGFLQEFLRKRPTLLIGTGISVAMGLPGMTELEKYLRDRFSEAYFAEREIWDEWQEALHRIEKHGLEGGLLEKQISEHLLCSIVEETAVFIGEADSSLRHELFRNPAHPFPLVRLIGHLVKSLHPMNPVLDIITPNYDHIIEYACDKLKIKCCSGFCGALVQRFSTEELEHISYIQRTVEVGRRGTEYVPQTQVRLLKPHGSLWWQRIGQTVFQSPVKLPEAQTLIITPGSTKYESSLTEAVVNHHREMANERLRKMSAIMIIGYGFNDGHLQTVLMQRLFEGGVDCLLLAMKLTANARTAIKGNPQIFAIEQGDSSRAVWYYNGESGSIPMNLWDLEVFINTVI